MDAVLIFRRKQDLSDGRIIEMVIWEVPEPVLGSTHRYKYRLFCGLPGKRLIGYDNERGKGDHRHYGDIEEAYRFIDIEQLQQDFWADVDRVWSEPSSAHD